MIFLEMYIFGKYSQRTIAGTNLLCSEYALQACFGGGKAPPNPFRKAILLSLGMVEMNFAYKINGCAFEAAIQSFRNIVDFGRSSHRNG